MVVIFIIITPPLKKLLSANSCIFGALCLDPVSNAPILRERENKNNKDFGTSSIEVNSPRSSTGVGDGKIYCELAVGL
jgi:hypothetical protein